MSPIDYQFLLQCVAGAIFVSAILYHRPILGTTLKEAWTICISVGAFVHLAFSFNPIPSGSMLNTLKIGDRVILNCFIYGYGQYNSPFGILPIKERIFDWRKPKRGEVVVFRSDHDIHKPFVKRLVGMPGDKVQVIDGDLYINNEICEETFLKNTTQKRSDGIVRPCKLYKRALPDGISYTFAKCQPKGSAIYDNTKPYYLKQKEYFMMGDNMDGSDDSRGNLGVIKYKNIVGRVELIGFSWDATKPFYLRPFYIKLNRFFTMLWPSNARKQSSQK